MRGGFDRLEIQARAAPLTEALNRDALYSLIESAEPAAADGCAMIVDMDELKRVNDSLGHAA